MKRQINVTITNIDDVPKTFTTVGDLIETIIIYYFTNKMYNQLKSFVIGLCIYIGEIMLVFNFSEKDIDENGNIKQI